MKWKKILVVYYSRTGITKELASELVQKTHGDLEEILPLESYKGFWGYQRALYHALFDRQPKLVRLSKNLADYDLVLIGGPIWGGSTSGPVRAFLAKNRQKLKNVAFFTTSGGKYQGENLFTQMEKISGIRPWATLAVSDKEMKKGSFKKLAEDFVNKLYHGSLKPEERTERKRRYQIASAAR